MEKTRYNILGSIDETLQKLVGNLEHVHTDLLFVEGQLQKLNIRIPFTLDITEHGEYKDMLPQVHVPKSYCISWRGEHKQAPFRLMYIANQGSSHESVDPVIESTWDVQIRIYRAIPEFLAAFHDHVYKWNTVATLNTKG